MTEYKIHEPKENPAAALVLLYKINKGVEFDDRIWDRRNFGRFISAASDLLEITKGFDNAKKCLDELAQKFEAANLEWTLETVTRHAYTWLQKRGKRNDAEIRKRFHNALLQQRSASADPVKGELTSAGQILSSLGVIKVIGGTGGSQDGSGDSQNGSVGRGVGEAALEAEETRRDRGNEGKIRPGGIARLG